jgi:hypothetical protein
VVDRDDEVESPAPEPEDEPRDRYDEPANEDWGHPELSSTHER